MSLFRPGHGDGVADFFGANLRTVQAPAPSGRVTNKRKSKTARFLYQILHTGYPGFTLLNKTHILPIDYFHRLVARETARFQNYANRVTGARDSAQRDRAIRRIPCACASDQPSRGMHKLSMCRMACACAPATAAMSAQLRRTHPYTSSNSRSPASGSHTGNLLDCCCTCYSLWLFSSSFAATLSPTHLALG